MSIARLGGRSRFTTLMRTPRQSRSTFPSEPIGRYRKQMMIGPPLLATLNAVGNIMVEARDAWWIIASAGVALHGADRGHVGDVDVLLSVDDA